MPEIKVEESEKRDLECVVCGYAFKRILVLATRSPVLFCIDCLREMGGVLESRIGVVRETYSDLRRRALEAEEACTEAEMALSRSDLDRELACAADAKNNCDACAHCYGRVFDALKKARGG